MRPRLFIYLALYRGLEVPTRFLLFLLTKSMRYLFPRTAALIAVVVTFSAQAEARYRFQQCKARVQGIMDGTLDDPYISKQTLRDRYLYQGHVRGMDYGLFNKSPPEQTYYKITYEGKPIPMLYFYCRVSGAASRPFPLLHERQLLLIYP